MQRHNVHVDRERLVQRSDVAVPGEHLGPGSPHRRPVDQLEDALGAVSTAGADDTGDGGIQPRGLQVRRPAQVVAREVGKPVVDTFHVWSNHDLEAPPAQDGAALRQPVRTYRAARGDNRDPVSRPKPAGTAERPDPPGVVSAQCRRT